MVTRRKVRTERFFAKRHAPLAAVLLVLPLVVGCPQEVPYAAPENGASENGAPAGEAPAFTPDENVGGSTGTDMAGSDSIEADPVPADTPANDTAEAPPERLPWEASESPAEAPEEAGELFAAVDEPPTASATPPVADDSKPEEEDDGFGAFLDEAYSSTTDEPASDSIEAVAETPPAEEPKPTAVPAVTEEQTSPPPTATESGAPDDDGWWLDSATKPAVETPVVEAPAEDPKPELEPKEPSATASANADLVDELWGDEPEEPATDAPAAKPPVEEPPGEEPWANESPMLPLDEPTAPADDASLFDEPEAEPEETEPLPEAAKPRAAERAAPMAADVMQPLPAVPVLEFNTRHLAWLLGGKLGLAELADLDGATPTEVAEWRSEVERLSKSLRIADPSTGGAATDADERVQNMLGAASRAGVELTQAHGVDHAALLEIALKTNALLVVAQDHPELATSVGRAVEGAAERAMLPKFLWEDAVRVLKSSSDADQTHDAVIRLHERVESFLR